MQDKENKAEISPEEKDQAVIREFVDIMCSCSIQKEGPVYTLPLMYMGNAAKRIFKFMSGYHYFEIQKLQKENEELKLTNEQLKTYLEDNRLHAESAISELTLQKYKADRLVEALELIRLSCDPEETQHAYFDYISREAIAEYRNDNQQTNYDITKEE